MTPKNHSNMNFMNTSNLVSTLKLFLVVATILISASICSASGNLYVAQTATGAASGASCSNAFPVSWFNSSSSWGSGSTQIGPGTTVHLCGTITTTLSAQASGASGNPITITFETGAKISVGACGSSGCINVNSLNWLVIDGSPSGTPCGYVARANVACNGIIEATNTGTGLGSSESIGIYARGASNLEIRNLMIRNMYVHTSNTDTGTGSNYYGVWYGAPSSDSVNIHNMTFHDMKAAVVGETPNSNNTVAYSEMYNVNWGSFMSGGHSIDGISHFSFHDNNVHDLANWDTTTDSFHHDGVMLASDDTQGNTVTQSDIYNNYFHGSAGSPTCSGGNPCVTAWIFLEGVHNIRVYNNVLVANSGEEAANGWIFFWSPTSALNNGDVVANNVVLGSNLSDGACVRVEGDSSMRLENNILSGCAYLTWMDSNTTWTALDDNIYQSSSLQWRNNNSVYNSLASWQSSSGGDANAKATTSSLNLGSTFTPSSGSPAIGAGANLSSLGVVTLDTDIAGNARPSSGNWDAGVYQTGATSSAQRPLPPTGLVVTIK
jgi:hypothetical protein